MRQKDVVVVPHDMSDYDRLGLEPTDEGEWNTIFPGSACATALVDRVVHHADVILVEGKSYRLRESEEAQKKKPKKPPTRRRRRNTKKD